MMQTAEPASRPLIGVDSGPDRLAAPVRSSAQDAVKAGPARGARSPRRPEKLTPKMRKLTVTFYSEQAEPNSLPDFAYAVAGTVLGHTKFLAYVEAEDPSQAAYGINAFFEVAQVESVSDGWCSFQDAPLRGTVAATRPRGFFSRLFGG